jgi:hypothetical protein
MGTVHGAAFQVKTMQTTLKKNERLTATKGASVAVPKVDYRPAGASKLTLYSIVEKH